jgi:hypothetical protein
MNKPHEYPDITDIFVQKAKGRRQRASLSFVEKLVILEKLRKNVEPLVRAGRERSNSKEIAKCLPTANRRLAGAGPFVNPRLCPACMEK